jgi:hypothetical protein
VVCVHPVRDPEAEITHEPAIASDSAAPTAMIKVSAPSIRPVDLSLFGLRFFCPSATIQTGATFHVSTGDQAIRNLPLEDGVFGFIDRARHPEIGSCRLTVALRVIDRRFVAPSRRIADRCLPW